MSSTTARSAGRLAWISAMTAIRMRAVSPWGPRAAIPPRENFRTALSARRERGSALAPPAMKRLDARCGQQAEQRHEVGVVATVHLERQVRDGDERDRHP